MFLPVQIYVVPRVGTGLVVLKGQWTAVCSSPQRHPAHPCAPSTW